jgi:hypothetical protein
MSLIDRYVFEVGRHLPRNEKEDILIELRSSIYDAVEDRFGNEPSEEQLSEFLSSMGPPKQVAASYYPEGQYLIGPALFPLFKLVAGIALAGVIGAQILAWAVAIFIAQDTISPFEAIGGLITSLPTTFGMVVVVFAILQWFDVQPELEEEAWDPTSLPSIEEVEPVKRGERIFGIIAGTAVLVYLVFFPQYIGFVTSPGGRFVANPVIPEYALWISISLLAGIALDVYLLWQGRWSAISRAAKIVVNILSAVVLALLVQAHSQWLAARDVGGLIPALERFAQDVNGNWQLFGMQAFRLAFAVALIVVVIETIGMAVRIVRTYLQQGSYSKTMKIGGAA